MKNSRSYIALFWLFVVLNSFFIWGEHKTFIVIFANILVILFSLMANDSEEISLKKVVAIPILFMTAFVLWSRFRVGTNIFGIIGKLTSLIAFSCLLCWPLKYIEQTFGLFKKVLVFFCIGSSIISILGAVGLLNSIPHFTLPPQSNLHQRLGIVYNVYGCFVTINNGSLLLPRACGFLQEPGHFAVIVGLVYLIERTLNRKRSVSIIIGGIFTFSMNFFIMAFLSEFFKITNVRQIAKAMRYLLLFVVGAFFIFSFLPKDIKDQLYFLFWERNLMEVVDTVQESGSIAEGLNERADDISEWQYNHLSDEKKLIGIGGLDEDGMLSDFRGIVLTTGYVGLSLSVCSVLSLIFLSLSWRQRLPLVGAITLIYMHRAWMMNNSMSIYFIVFMASVLYRLQDENLLVSKEIIVKSDREN
ncbi:MAG: hypothetical protein IK148_02275 [Prevotella sp.]|nr:hypothetical protein [Prevotella sp.]